MNKGRHSVDSFALAKQCVTPLVSCLVEPLDILLIVCRAQFVHFRLLQGHLDRLAADGTDVLLLVKDPIHKLQAAVRPGTLTQAPGEGLMNGEAGALQQAAAVGGTKMEWTGWYLIPQQPLQDHLQVPGAASSYLICPSYPAQGRQNARTAKAAVRCLGGYHYALQQ